MIIIAFSDKTSKILPKILCGKIKHCAPISVHNNTLVMHQFISHNNIVKIKLNMRDIRILQRYGWRFVYLTGDMLNNININTRVSSTANFNKTFKKVTGMTPSEYRSNRHSMIS